MTIQQQKYKSGDIVVLKSGGPPMTVQTYDSTDRYLWCQWFSGKKLETGRFAEDSLDPAPADKSE